MMNLKAEIYRDIVANCDVLLDRLKDAELTNDTPEGRMIYQCRWLKEQTQKNNLPLPVEDYIHTLRYVYTDSSLMHIASAEDKYWEEVQIYIHRLVKLTKGLPLIKPAYYPYAIRSIEALLVLLHTATRPLDQYEQGLIGELTQLKRLLKKKGGGELPLESYLPDYPNFREVYSMTGSSTEDLPNGKFLTKTVAHLVFEGVRPNTWVTPEDADRETIGL